MSVRNRGGIHKHSAAGEARGYTNRLSRDNAGGRVGCDKSVAGASADALADRFARADANRFTRAFADRFARADANRFTRAFAHRVACADALEFAEK